MRLGNGPLMRPYRLQTMGNFIRLVRATEAARVYLQSYADKLFWLAPPMARNGVPSFKLMSVPTRQTPASWSEGETFG